MEIGYIEGKYGEEEEWQSSKVRDRHWIGLWKTIKLNRDTF